MGWSGEMSYIKVFFLTVPCLVQPSLTHFCEILRTQVSAQMSPLRENFPNLQCEVATSSYSISPPSVIALRTIHSYTLHICIYFVFVWNILGL